MVNNEEEIIEEEVSPKDNELNSSEKIAPPPWSPHIPAITAFFLGIGGGLAVSYVNLRRFGKERTDTIIPLGLLGGASLVVSLLLPQVIPSIVKYIVIALIFYFYHKNEFEEWEKNDPIGYPDNWWTAIGWGLLGLLIYLTIIVLFFMIFDIPFLPQSRNLQPLR
jgi:formate-dependent nitrite reductase membrane component NrfD